MAEIILGPPGTGKTTTLLDIVDSALKSGIPPDKIAFVSFTRRAIHEAVTRACLKFNLSESQLPYFRTIHSLCFRQLGLRSSEVFEGAKLREFADWIGVKITGKWSEDGLISGFEDGDRVLFMENLARARGISLQNLYKDSDENLRWSEIERIVRGLKIFKQENGLYDFSDMLDLFIQRGHAPELDLLICDETQDQSHLQWKVIDKLSLHAKRVVVAFDDDQQVHYWAGSDRERILNQPGDVTILNQSYRVPISVQTLANSIIDRISQRRQKIWQPRSEIGFVERMNSFYKVDLSNSDILILVRNTYLLNPIEFELRRQGIFYEKNGYSSIKQSMLKAIVDWEQLRNGIQIPINAVVNIYDFMSSGVGVARGFKKLPMFHPDEFVSMNTLVENGGLLANPSFIWHEALDRIPHTDRDYILAARRKGEKVLDKPRVRLSTIHSAKGAEANHVILLKEQARKTHREMSVDPDSENRVWYVGVTRTREKLSIVESSNDRYYPFI